MMANAAQFQEMIPFLTDVAMRAAVLLGMAALATGALRRSSAAVRHLVWTSALVGVLALPAVRALTPLEIPLWTVSAREAVLAPGATAVPVPVTASADGSTRTTAGPVAATESAPSAAHSSPSASVDASRTGVVPPLLAIWVLGFLGFMLPIAAGRIGLRRLAARSAEVRSSRIRHRATRLALRTGVRRRYRLLEGPEGTMPMTFGLSRPAIVLPSGAERWPDARLDAVLLHELAHLGRHDTLTQLLAEVVRALHWFDPLAWLAVHRLRIERELACDDVALAAGARPSEYAGELLRIARAYRSRTAPVAAVAMARPSQVGTRLRAILDESRSHRRAGRVRTTATLLVATALVVGCASATAAERSESVPDRAAEAPPPDGPDVSPRPERPEAEAPAVAPGEPAVFAAPAAPVAAGPAGGVWQSPTCIAEGDRWSRMQHQSRNGRVTIQMRRRGCDFELRMEGDVDFDAGTMVVSRMGAGSRLRILEQSRGGDHALDIRPGPGGEPVYDYERDGRDHAFDVEARAWFRAALESLFRTTGFMASERVEALLRDGGVEAVMRELGELETGHVYARYTRALLEQAALEESELRALVRASPRRVDSDHYMAGILEAVATHHPLRGGLLDDYVQAAAGLDSDHYRTGVLQAALETDRLTGPQIATVLRAAGTMDSDHYRTRILTGIADRYALVPAFRADYLAATAGMDSDHYRTQVLGRLMERSDLTASEKAEVLRATRMIDSDHYRSRLLAGVARTGLDDPALHAAFFEVAAGLDSDHYYRRSMAVLLDQGVDARLLATILASATRALDSDHYLSEMLIEIVDRYPIEGEVRDAFLQAMDSIDSRNYRGRVADALLRAERR